MGLLAPVNATAKINEVKIEYQTIKNEDVIYRPSNEVIEKLRADFVARTQHQVAPKNHGRYQCVAWAKKVTGVFGTWGNGGRKLSLNSTGQIGDALIFKYIHVAVVIGRVGEILTITEANYDLRGNVRIRQISAFDSSIKGFHSF